ncbi:MAG TPA: hypothetical protein VEH47_07955 [Candidatus Acidoferrales bacterium]|nr:hypothetical protein [Candidatus Acidoferrales bacterium]
MTDGTDKNTAMLERGRGIVAAIDAQLARMGRVLEMQTGSAIRPNQEEEMRLRTLVRAFAEWAREARETGIEPEKEFSSAIIARIIHSAVPLTVKPTTKDAFLTAWLYGDLIEEPGPPAKKPSTMALENWP